MCKPQPYGINGFNTGNNLLFFFFFQKQVMQLALIYIWVNQVRAQITGEPELYRDLENDNNKNNI